MMIVRAIDRCPFMSVHRAVTDDSETGVPATRTAAERLETLHLTLALLGSGLVQDRMRVRKAADQARNGRKSESGGKKER